MKKRPPLFVAVVCGLAATMFAQGQKIQQKIQPVAAQIVLGSDVTQKEEPVPVELTRIKDLDVKPLSLGEVTTHLRNVLPATAFTAKQSAPVPPPSSGTASSTPASLFSSPGGVEVRPFRNSSVDVPPNRVAWLQVNGNIYSTFYGEHSLAAQYGSNRVSLRANQNIVTATFLPANEAEWRSRSTTFIIRIRATNLGPANRAFLNGQAVTFNSVGPFEWATMVSAPTGRIGVTIPPSSSARIVWSISAKRFE